MTRFLLAAFACLIAAAPVHAQQRLGPAAFYGTWTGSGVAENRDSIYFAVTQRDLDVVIKPLDNGFSVTWTTVIRKGGDPTQPNVRQRETTRTFRPSPQGRMWRAVESGDPLAGKTLAWARIEKQTLTIYQMTVLPNGAYEIEQYDRTLSGTGMDLRFTLRRDREPVRTVTAKLVKTAQ
jgi:hypothetical protein